MIDLDDGLRRLAEIPAPAELAVIDADVLEKVGGHRFGPRRNSGVLGVALVAGALVMGIGAGTVPSRDASARSVGPLGGAPELAPSTLLADR